MKIVILGAGSVGASVAASLVSEKNDITIIDWDENILGSLQERLDLRGIVGNATHPSVLGEAGLADADLLVASMPNDESNLVACRIAKMLFNVPACIARLRSAEFIEHPALRGETGFSVDHVICPEHSVTQSIRKLIDYPEALQVLEFAGGKLTLVAARALTGAPLVGCRIAELGAHVPNIEARIVAVFRADRPVPVDGETTIAAGDEIFCLAPTKYIRKFLAQLRPLEKSVRVVMIAGAGNIGLRLARALDADFRVKLIEPDYRQCERAALQLDSVLVLNGDATNEDLLAEEQVSEVDLFLAVTNNDGTNIMASLLAKRMGAARVIALINRRAYGELVEGGQIDIAIAPSQTTLSELLAYVRRGDIVAVHALRRGAAEAIEVVAHGDSRSSRVIGKRVEDLELFGAPHAGATIGAIVRGRADAAEVIMAHHDVVIQAEDHVVVFVANKRMLPKVEELFAVGIGFL